MPGLPGMEGMEGMTHDQAAQNELFVAQMLVAQAAQAASMVCLLLPLPLPSPCSNVPHRSRFLPGTGGGGGIPPDDSGGGGPGGGARVGGPGGRLFCRVRGEKPRPRPHRSIAPSSCPGVVLP